MVETNNLADDIEMTEAEAEKVTKELEKTMMDDEMIDNDDLLEDDPALRAEQDETTIQPSPTVEQNSGV